jgi:transposase InsO family protein
MLSFKEYVSDREVIDEATTSSRMHAKFRLRTSKTKRKQRSKIATHTVASGKKAESRARRMAIRMMKKRMLRGRKLRNLAPDEKASIEKRMKTKMAQIKQMTSGLVATVRRIEKSRLTHGEVSRGKTRRVF